MLSVRSPDRNSDVRNRYRGAVVRAGLFHSQESRQAVHPCGAHGRRAGQLSFPRRAALLHATVACQVGTSFTGLRPTQLACCPAFDAVARKRRHLGVHNTQRNNRTITKGTIVSVLSLMIVIPHRQPRSTQHEDSFRCWWCICTNL